MSLANLPNDRPVGPLFKRSLNKDLKVVNSFVEPFIDQALSLPQSELENITKSSESFTFLHALASFTRDRKVIRDQIVAVLLAGRDTTAATLSWTFHEISTKPDIVAKLRAEILDRVGPTNAPTYEDLKSMKYLQAVMSETLRLYPAVPFNLRTAIEDTTLPRGGGDDGLQPVGVPKGTFIGYSPIIMHRRRDLYPATYSDGKTPFPDPAQFVPERWLGGWMPKSWHYIPFNGGPRICIGQQFALAEMGYTIVRILQRYDKVVSYMGPDDEVLKCEIVLTPGKGVKVGFWEAEKR